jgi:hypothetical protein
MWSESQVSPPAAPTTNVTVDNTALNPVPVSGTVTVDTSSLATSALQTSGNASLTSIDGKLKTGTQTAAAALGVTLSSDGVITTANSPQPTAFQAQITPTNGVATQFPSVVCKQGIWIQPAWTNSVVALIGASDVAPAKGAEIQPGSSPMFFQCTNANVFYHRGTAASGCLLNWWAN